MPNPNDRARDGATRLLTLLREVRAAKPEARDFALFDRRDALAGLGVPHDRIDGFDASDDAALDGHIADARAVATAYGAPQDDDHSALWGESGQQVMQGGAGDDSLGVTTAKSPPLVNPLLPEIPWPKNGPSWTPYNPTKGILPEPPKAAAPPKPILPENFVAQQIDRQVRALLDTIAAGEVDEAKAKASGFSSVYDTPYGYGQYGRPPKPFTQMTLGELKVFQRQMVNNQRSLPAERRSSAAGPFQMMPKTLSDMQRSMGLDDRAVFSRDLQDQIALSLLKRRGLDDYRYGSLPAEDFQRNLAMEFASVGMPTDGKSYHNQPVGTSAEKARAAILNLKPR